MTSDMRQMTITRTDLLDILKNNLKKHHDTFIKAQVAYRNKAIEELDQMAKDAREGNRIRRSMQAPQPEDHSSDYESTILMLELCVDETISIEASDFDRLVMDNWGWKNSWTQTTSSYV